MWKYLQYSVVFVMVAFLASGCGGVGKEAIGSTEVPEQSVDTDRVSLTVTKPDGTIKELDLSITPQVTQSGLIRGFSVRSMAMGYGYEGKLRVVPIDMVFEGAEPGAFEIGGVGHVFRKETGVKIGEISHYDVPQLESKSGVVTVSQIGSKETGSFKGNFQGIFTPHDSLEEYQVNCDFSIPY